MDFEWDPEKAASNLKKHRISFAFATQVFDDPALLEEIDMSNGYDEERWTVIGFAGKKMLAVVYTLRGTKIRIISARKAETHERERYWNG